MADAGLRAAEHILTTSFRPEREKTMTWLFSDALIFVIVMDRDSRVRDEIINHDTFGIALVYNCDQ